MEIIDWDEFLIDYEQVVSELCIKFQFLSAQLKRSLKYSPIERVDGRVKHKASIIEKANRKGFRFDELSTRMEDIAGVRIICQFTEDINKVIGIIRERADMRILTERDYITNTKPSGYRSYHIHIVYPINMLSGRKEMLAEIQIRTMAMNFWSTIEHSLRYKYSDRLPEELQQRLHLAAEAAYKLDLEMSTIRDEIMEAQKIVKVREDLVDKINKKIQSLYYIEKIDRVSELHKKFLDLYSEGNIEKLQDFNCHLGTLTAIYKAQPQ